jgi:hypothetical protein
MKYVLDLNKSRSDELKCFLEEGNEVIVSDAFYVECFKSENPYGTMEKHFKLLKQFPQSIFVSFSRGELFRSELMSGRPVNNNEIINYETTDNFRNILRLNEAQLKENLCSYKETLEGLIKDHNDFSETFIRGLAAKAGQLDLKPYRDDAEKHHADIAEVSLEATRKLLETQYEQAFDFEEFKKRKSIIFMVTYALAWKVVKWGLERGYEQASPKTIGNDGFDLIYVSLSCFFDGILTGEPWLKECRESILLFYEKE